MSLFPSEDLADDDYSDVEGERRASSSAKLDRKKKREDSLRVQPDLGSSQDALCEQDACVG